MYSEAPNIPSLPSGALRFPLPPAGADDSSNDICGCWITADNSTTYEEMCRRLEGVKTKADILALSTTPSTVEAISTATPRWRAEVEQLRAQQQK